MAQITKVKELQYMDAEYNHFLNLILNRCQEQLNLQQIGRNYYDPSAAIPMTVRVREQQTFKLVFENNFKFHSIKCPSASIIISAIRLACI